MRRLLCLGLVLLLSGCQGAQTPPPEPTPTPSPEVIDFYTFAGQVNGERQAKLETDEVLDPSAWMADFPEELDLLSQEERTQLATPHEQPNRALTREELAQDVETAFLLLKTTYGAYGYFGGDEVFLPLKDAALAELAEMRFPTVTLLEELLVTRLAPVLRDGHFSIGGTSLIDTLTMYYVPDLYLDDVSGLDNAYLKPTIAEDGRIAYGFVTQAADPDGLPQTAVIQGTEVPLTWQAAQPDGRRNYAFSETTWEGVPVLQSKRMSPQDLPQWETALERLSTCGAEYRDTPLLIFDVRSNPGGSDEYIMNFFEGFTGQPAQPKRSGGHKVSRLGVDALGYPAERLGSWRTYQDPGVWVEREGLVFLLQDAATASSGETAVRFFRSLDNVVIVGSNSGGCALVPNNKNFFLPHSGLQLYFGTGLSFCETLENRDGVGYPPDLWVAPARAREATLALIDYYDLSNAES